jgi:glycerol kinase
VPIISAGTAEGTAYGAAVAAGLATGLWRTLMDIPLGQGHRWRPGMDVERRAQLYARWKRALQRSLGWLDQ